MKTQLPNAREFLKRSIAWCTAGGGRCAPWRIPRQMISDFGSATFGLSTAITFAASSDDLFLITALRSLLPHYIGLAPLTLYRGDSLWNRRRRTYGLAWTTELEVARAAARAGVSAKTTASGQAIISAPAHGEDRYGE
jgi:hypothetical protein